MAWKIIYTKEAEKDLENLDGSQRKYVLKAIKKVSENPLPSNEGGYGKALGNHKTGKLAGYLKIKLLKQGLRVVYGIERRDEIMEVVVISIRDDDTVYKMASERIK